MNRAPAQPNRRPVPLNGPWSSAASVSASPGTQTTGSIGSTTSVNATNKTTSENSAPKMRNQEQPNVEVSSPQCTSLHATGKVLGKNLVNKGGSAAGVNSNNPISAAIDTGEKLGNAEVALRGLQKWGIAAIRCHICKKVKKLDQYSNRQILNYRDSIYNEYAPSGRCKSKTATCKSCTAGVVTELDCMICQERKPLKKFMKAQRRTPDAARCKRCVQICLDTDRQFEAADEDDYEDDTEDSEEESDIDVDDPRGKYDTDTIQLTAQFEAMIMNPKPAETKANKTPSVCVTEDTLIPELETPNSGYFSPDFTRTADEASGKMNTQWQTVNAASKNARYAFGASITSSVGTRTDGTPTPKTTFAIETPVQSTQQVRPGPKGWVRIKKGPEAEEARLWTETSDRAKQNGWSIYGGQPRLFKKKAKRQNEESDEDEDADDEE